MGNFLRSVWGYFTSDGWGDDIPSDTDNDTPQASQQDTNAIQSALSPISSALSGAEPWAAGLLILVGLFLIVALVHEVKNA